MAKDGMANFFLGFGIGVGVGLLFAPKSGEETRDLLLNKADEAKEHLKKQTEGLRESASDLVDKGRDEIFRWAIVGGVMISTACVVILAIAGMVMFRLVSKMQARIDHVADRYEPLIDTSRRIAEDLAPKVARIATNIEGVTANAQDITEVAKDQAHRFAEVGRDVADRAKAQVARVDAAVDETVEHLQHAGEDLKTAAKKPVREMSAVLAGVRAAVSAYGHGARRPGIDHIPQDEEMFI
jgi:gas vesicle protein